MKPKPFNKKIMQLFKVVIILFFFIPAILHYMLPNDPMLIVTSYDILWIGFFMCFVMAIVLLFKPSKKKMKG